MLDCELLLNLEWVSVGLCLQVVWKTVQAKLQLQLQPQTVRFLTWAALLRNCLKCSWNLLFHFTGTGADHHNIISDSRRQCTLYYSAMSSCGWRKSQDACFMGKCWNWPLNQEGKFAPVGPPCGAWRGGVRGRSQALRLAEGTRLWLMWECRGVEPYPLHHEARRKVWCSIMRVHTTRPHM